MEVSAALGDPARQTALHKRKSVALASDAADLEINMVAAAV
ncbi:hypothetical protein OH492_08740 [Vibrio chagasii]|nr:hypothetical protein [Vibrio chagasii]